MARFRKIDVRMWGDERFNRLSPITCSGQALWIYLLTGRQTSIIPGLIVAGKATLAESLRWSPEGLAKAFEEVLREGLAEADWKAPLIWIPNAIKYNSPANPNVVKSWRDTWDEIPECKLKDKAHTALKEFLKGFGKGFAEAFDRALPKGMAKQEQEQEQEQECIPTPSASGTNGTPIPSKKSPKGGIKPRPARPEHKQAVDDFCARWEAKYGDAYPLNTGKDGAAVAWMLDQTGRDPAKLSAVFERYFADDDLFITNAKHSLAVLRSQFPRHKVGQPVAAGSFFREDN